MTVFVPFVSFVSFVDPNALASFVDWDAACRGGPLVV